jgi:hypothetical protein
LDILPKGVGGLIGVLLQAEKKKDIPTSQNPSAKISANLDLFEPCFTLTPVYQPHSMIILGKNE